MILAATDVLVAQNIGFAIIGAFMIVGAIRVVTTRNVVHAALWLVVVLAGSAAQFVLLAAEFVALTQVLVYIGAIIVLFLFGIMLTRAQLGNSDDLDNHQKPLALAIALGMVGIVGYALWDAFGTNRVELVGKTTAELGQTTAQVSDTIFGPYLIAFEAVSVLLLAALIGAIVLARRD
jgi:NADH-quinone oxidoreductase subunit J